MYNYDDDDDEDSYAVNPLLDESQDDVPTKPGGGVGGGGPKSHSKKKTKVVSPSRGVKTLPTPHATTKPVDLTKPDPDGHTPGYVGPPAKGSEQEAGLNFENITGQIKQYICFDPKKQNCLIGMGVIALIVLSVVGGGRKKFL
jgi:hypothetical protein